MSENRLEDLYKEIKAAGFAVERKAKTEEIPRVHLNVDAPSSFDDETKYRFILLVQSRNDIENIVPIENPPDIVQMIYLFPHEVAENQKLDTARLVNLINKIAPLPGFNYDELFNRCYFKYCYPFSEQPSQELFTRRALDLIVTTLDVYSATIEKVSTGKQSLEELLASLQK